MRAKNSDDKLCKGILNRKQLKNGLFNFEKNEFERGISKTRTENLASFSTDDQMEKKIII